jgi:hypothetical protein
MNLSPLFSNDNGYGAWATATVMATATATNEYLSPHFGNYDSNCKQQQAMAK